MKKTLFVLAMVAAAHAPFSTLHAQVVGEDSFERLEVHYVTPDLNVATSQLGDRKTLSIDIPGYVQGGEVGLPAVPMRTDMIVVPFCDGITVEVSNAVFDTLPAPNFESATRNFHPLQPSRRKSDTSALVPVVNSQAYATSQFIGFDLAKVDEIGIARDRRLALLRFSPVQVNPVTGQMIVCRSADVTLRYRNADAQRTLDLYRRYSSPAFNPGQTLNGAILSKAVRSDAPLRMVIVLGKNLGDGSALADFVDFKRKQGLMLDLLNYADYGNTVAMVSALRALYTGATDEAPAPTFVLLVGDHQQMPAVPTELPNSNYMVSSYGFERHVTDNPYASWTSDKLRDCYIGRFSAEDVATLESIVDKTLYYERYAFTDDSYLVKAVLIAGYDNNSTQETGWTPNSAMRCADPTMDYIAKYYITADNGYDNITYYKNRTNYHPDGVTVTGNCTGSGVSTTLLRLYNEGVGWANYSAHGSETSWAMPTLSVSNVASMTNNGKPGIFIGNCCQSNWFQNTNSQCLGEALLRKGSRGGAAAYIGATNSTLWDEDFYWSVGYRSNVYGTMNATYDASNRGTYDCLFHSHGEPLSQWGVTAGSMVFDGLMAVNTAASTSSNESDIVDYYWEIYELMGDPSLMPWLGRAATLAPTIQNTGSSLSVTAVPYAYVAITDTASGVALLSAGFAGADGTVTLPVPAHGSTALLSVTAQGYKPYFTTLGDVVGIAGATLDAPEITICPNPVATSCSVTADGLQCVDLLDLYGRQLSTLQAPKAELNLQDLPAGLYLLRIHTASGVFTRKIVKQ